MAISHAFEPNLTVRLRIFQLIAFPGHVWVWIAARLCGMDFSCEPVRGDEEDTGEEDGVA